MEASSVTIEVKQEIGNNGKACLNIKIIKVIKDQIITQEETVQLEEDQDKIVLSSNDDAYKLAISPTGNIQIFSNDTNTDKLILKSNTAVEFLGKAHVNDLEVEADLFINSGILDSKRCTIKCQHDFNNFGVIYGTEKLHVNLKRGALFNEGAIYSGNPQDIGKDSEFIYKGFGLKVGSKGVIYALDKMQLINSGDLYVAGQIVSGLELSYRGIRNIYICENAFMLSKNRAYINCEGFADIQGTVGARVDFALRPIKGLRNAETGRIGSKGFVTIETKGRLENFNSIEAGKFIFGTAREILSFNKILSHGHAILDGYKTFYNEGDLLSKGDGIFDAHGSDFVNAAGARTLARNNFVYGRHVYNMGDPNAFINNFQIEAQQPLTVTDEIYSNQDGLIAGLDRVDIIGERFENSGLILSKDNATVKAKQMNNSGEVLANILTIKIQNIFKQYASGKITGVEALHLLSGEVVNEGVICAFKTLDLEVSTVLENAVSGIISAKDALLLMCAGIVKNVGNIKSYANIVIKAREVMLDVTTSRVVSEDQIKILAEFAIQNAGLLSGKNIELITSNLDSSIKLFQTSDISADQMSAVSDNIHNAGQIKANKSINIESKILFENVASGYISVQDAIDIRSGNLVNCGFIDAVKQMSLDVHNVLQNNVGGTLTSNGTIAIICASIVQNLGTIESLKELKLEALNMLQNIATGKIISQEKLQLIAKFALENAGLIAGKTAEIVTGEVDALKSGLSKNTLKEHVVFSNLASGVIQVKDALEILGKSGSNDGVITAKIAKLDFTEELHNSGTISIEEKLTLKAHKTLFLLRNGKIQAKEALTIISDLKIYSEADILAYKVLLMIAPTIEHKSGQIESMQDLTIEALDWMLAGQVKAGHDLIAKIKEKWIKDKKGNFEAGNSAKLYLDKGYVFEQELQAKNHLELHAGSNSEFKFLKDVTSAGDLIVNSKNIINGVHQGAFARLKAGRQFKATCDKFNNQHGGVFGQKGVTVIANNQINNGVASSSNGSFIVSGGAAEFKAEKGGFLNQHAEISVANKCTFDTSGVLQNTSGKVRIGGDLSVKALAVNNEMKYTSSWSDDRRTGSGKALSERPVFTVGGNAAIAAPGNFNSKGGDLDIGGSCIFTRGAFAGTELEEFTHSTSVGSRTEYRKGGRRYGFCGPHEDEAFTVYYDVPHHNTTAIYTARLNVGKNLTGTDLSAKYKISGMTVGGQLDLKFTELNFERTIDPSVMNKTCTTEPSKLITGVQIKSAKLEGSGLDSKLKIADKLEIEEFFTAKVGSFSLEQNSLLKVMSALNLIVEGDISIAGTIEAQDAFIAALHGDIDIKSTITRLQLRFGDSENFEDILNRARICAGNILQMYAGNNITFEAAELESGAGGTFIQAMANILDLSVGLVRQRVKYFYERRKQGFTRDTDISQSSSKHKSDGLIRMEANNSVILQAPEITADAAEIISKTGKTKILDTQELHEHEEKIEIKKRRFTGTKKKTKNSNRYSIRSKGAKFKVNRLLLAGKEGVEVCNITSTAAHNILSSPDGEVSILLGRNRFVSSSMTSSKDPYWQKSKTENIESAIYSASNISGAITIDASRVMLETVRGKLLSFLAQIEQTNKHPSDIIYSTVDEYYSRHSKTKQGPGSGLIALVAVATAIATQGTCAGWAAELGFKAGAHAMVTAGFTGLCSEAAASIVANNGNPLKAIQALASVDTVKSLATSMISAGILHKVCEVLKIPKLEDRVFLKHAEYNIAKSSVSTILNASINNQDLDEAVLAGLVEAVIATVLAATAINKSKEELNKIKNNIMHASLGALKATVVGRNGPLVGGLDGLITAILPEYFPDKSAEAEKLPEVNAEEAKQQEATVLQQNEFKEQDNENEEKEFMALDELSANNLNEKPKTENSSWLQRGIDKAASLVIGTAHADESLESYPANMPPIYGLANSSTNSLDELNHGIKISDNGMSCSKVEENSHLPFLPHVIVKPQSERKPISYMFDRFKDTNTTVEHGNNLISNIGAGVSGSKTTKGFIVSSEESLGSIDVNRIMEEFKKNPGRYPTDAEELQRLMREVQPVETPQCTYNHDIVYSKTIAGCCLGVAKGAAKELAELVLAKKFDPTVVLKDTAKGCMYGMLQGHKVALNELYECQKENILEVAEAKVLKESYITDVNSREMAIKILAEEIRKKNEEQYKFSSTSPRP